MPVTTIRCRRATRRHPIRNAPNAFVEFVYPPPYGRFWRLALTDISVSGFSFVFNDEVPDLENGETIDRVVIRLGDCEINGDCLIMHVTGESGIGAVCGALFYPASDTDLIKLKSLIAGIEAASTAAR